jgi:hypothetical protein
MNKAFRGFLAITAIVFLGMCSTSSTSITGSWTKPEYQPQKYDKIVILGIARVSENRRMFEDQVETRLIEKGYPVIAALDLLPPNAAIGTITKEIVWDIFKSAGIDGVFTMSMRHQEDTRRYVPGRSTYYTPYHSTIGFYDYYGGFGSYYYTPGYYTGSYQVFLEANFFDFETDELIWSAQSKSTNYEDVHKMAVSYADAIVKDFISQNVVPVPEGSSKK